MHPPWISHSNYKKKKRLNLEKNKKIWHVAKNYIGCKR